MFHTLMVMELLYLRVTVVHFFVNEALSHHEQIDIWHHMGIFRHHVDLFYTRLFCNALDP